MLLCHCTPADGAKILQQRMNPSLSCAFVDEGGRALEREGEHGQGRHSQGGNGAGGGGFLHRLARQGSASPQQGSVLARGVLRNRQMTRTQSPENGEPCAYAGSRQGDAEGATRRRDRPCPESAARPAAGRRRRRRARQLDVSQGASARRTGGRLLSCHLSEVADHAVATDWYDRYRAVLRDDEKGVDKVVRAISAARRRRSRFSTASLRSSARTGARYASLKAKGYPVGSSVVEAANKVLVNQRMKRAGQRWSMRSECPYLQGDVGPLRRGGR